MKRINRSLFSGQPLVGFSLVGFSLVGNPLLGFCLLSACLLPLTSCGGGGSGGGPQTASVGGTLAVLQGETATLEAEPNDSASTSHRLGTLRLGESRRILGSITDSGSDELDGFQVVVSPRANLQITLTATNQSADLDVYLVDPVSLLFVGELTTSSANESGSFVVQGPVFVVIDSATGTSDYELMLEALTPPNPVMEIEPNNTALAGQYFGGINSGTSLNVTGDLASGDTAEYLLLSFATGATLNLNLTFDSANDYEMRVYDATNDLSAPTLLQTFDSGDPSSESGTLAVPAMTLLAVEIYPFSGTGLWDLTLSVPSSVLAAGTRMPLNTKPRGNVDALRSNLRKSPQVADFLSESAPFLPGEIVVGTHGIADLDYAMALRGGEVAQKGQHTVQQLRFELPLNLNEDEQKAYTTALVASLAGLSEVEYAEPNYLYQPLAVETRPNDNFYNLQWHYEAINLPSAWDLQQGSSSIITAILDTGSTPHPDLDGREIQGIDMISNPTIAGDGDGVDSDPFDVGDGTGPQPSSFHGSHVAGTVGAETNNASGVAGVTWAGGIMHVRLLGIGGGSNGDIANGILYAAGLANGSGFVPAQRADVINMSLGGPGFSQTMQNAVTAARNAGVVVIAAAGNENSSTPSYPAAYDDVISVAAVGYDLTRAPYSNFHPTVDIAAPGGNVGVDLNGDGYADGVLSTKPDDSVNPTNYASYSFYQGTSMAAPHVAGVAALVLSENPGLTVAQVENILMQTSTDLGVAGRDDIFGEGLVNAFAAVQQAGGGGGGAPVLTLGENTILLGSASGASTLACRNVTVSNTGGGSLMVTGVPVTTQSGGAWLSATPVGALSGTSTDTTAVQVCADPTGLADGTYRGSVTVMSNGMDRVVEVIYTVGGNTAGTNYTLYVLAVNADTLETVAQVTLQTQGNLTYNFGALDPGQYFIVAGTDENGNDLICDEGEPLCGVYPSLELPSVIELAAGEQLVGRDFPLQAVFTTSSTSTSGSGFRLMPAPSTQEVSAEGLVQ